MKIKTNKLNEIALDWAVCCIEGQQMSRYTRYSTDWSQGGPIIEREGIELLCNVTERMAARFKSAHADWFACLRSNRLEHHHGPTPLIAAMRCFIASKLGDEIEVPEELNPED